MTHTHRWRLSEMPREGAYDGECGGCGATRRFPLDPAVDWHAMARIPTKVNGVPSFLRPFAWDQSGLVRGKVTD